jgi:serine/threonine protein kinase
VDAAPWAQQMAQREACTLALLGCSHVNMLKPQQLVLTRDYISLVSQHAGGGTLYDYCQKHRLSEDVAAYFLRQLVSVIQYMHAGNVAYRDVKLDNMLLTDSTPPRLVLCDFGTSKTWDPSGYGPHMHTFLGTPGEHTPSVDAGRLMQTGIPAHTCEAAATAVCSQPQMHGLIVLSWCGAKSLLRNALQRTGMGVLHCIAKHSRKSSIIVRLLVLVYPGCIGDGLPHHGVCLFTVAPTQVCLAAVSNVQKHPC